MTSQIVGREDERAAAAAFMAESRTPPPRWRWRVRQASASRPSGSRDSTSRATMGSASLVRPAEAERSLVHVGLGDLLEDVIDEALPT